MSTAAVMLGKRRYQPNWRRLRRFLLGGGANQPLPHAFDCGRYVARLSCHCFPKIADKRAPALGLTEGKYTVFEAARRIHEFDQAAADPHRLSYSPRRAEPYRRKLALALDIIRGGPELGVRANPLAALIGAQRDRFERIPVDGFRQVRRSDGVFPAGETAVMASDGHHPPRSGGRREVLEWGAPETASSPRAPS